MHHPPENDDTSELIQNHYDRWPYPQIPLFAKVHPEQLWQLNVKWMIAQSGQRPPQGAARIWIAGCGTFQPYLFVQSNPGSSLLATDWSENSLKRAKLRCRLHGLRKLEFEKIDLNDIESFPEETFDFIECYGVLMVLKDPLKTLRAFHERLAPGGILRIMVYPHYGRQRIFQIQRLARLLGFHSAGADHPKRLTAFMSQLPDAHPLKYAFFTYPDSHNPIGISDGFLHAGDRGFTGTQIASLIDEAGFQIGFAMHRPWGQPKEMEAALGIENQDPAFWLHYLDLWQSLKGNFILTLTKKAPASVKLNDFHNPVFNWHTEGIGFRQRARLLRLAVTGGSLQSRTHDGALRISAQTMRDLLRAKRTADTQVFFPVGKALGPAFTSSSRTAPVYHSWTLGLDALSPNPLYSHLFDAYVWDAEGRLPSIKNQIEKWKTCARPLEDEQHPFGLTPFGTFQHDPAKVAQAAELYRWENRSNFSGCEIENESFEFEKLKDYLRTFSLPKQNWTDSQLRELWVLLFSFHRLFLRAKPA